MFSYLFLLAYFIPQTDFIFNRTTDFWEFKEQIFMKYSKEIMRKYFFPLATSFLGNLWLLTGQVSGYQQIYKGILILIILTSLLVALKNIWHLLSDKKTTIYLGTALFALLFNSLIISLNDLPNIIVFLIGFFALYGFGHIFMKCSS